MFRRFVSIAIVAMLCMFGSFAAPTSSATQRSAASPEARTEGYFESIRKDPNLLVAFLLEMPKGGDLHSHLSGAIYAETLIQWAIAGNACVDPKTDSLTSSLRQSSGEAVCPPPLVFAKNAETDPELYRNMIDAYSMRNWKLSGQSGHDHFFDTFAKFGAATEPENTSKMLADTADRAASQRELYQELMFTPTGKAFSSMMNSDAVKNMKLKDNATVQDFAALQKALEQNGMGKAVQEITQFVDAEQAERDALLQCNSAGAHPGCQVTQRYLFQVSRGKAREVVFAQILAGFELAKMDPRFVSLNLVMPEDYYVPIRDFSLQMQMLKYLRAQFSTVPVTLHAGELAAGLVPPEDLRDHIRQSVETAGADRIGHGVDVMNETNPHQLLEEMASRKIMVEICLTSNDTILGVSGRKHPLHDYMQAGVPVALATDDEGVSRSDMTHEYLRGVEDQDLTYANLKGMARTSLQYAFVPGQSLWADATAFKPVAECSSAKIGETATATCQTFLDKSEKARLQWKLEWQFREFEGRKWPAAVASKN